MSNVTNRAQLSAAVREYYDRLLLMTAYPTLIYTKFAQTRILPEKSGDTVVFRRFVKLDTVEIDAVYKFSLIDLEAYGESYGDKGQAQAA